VGNAKLHLLVINAKLHLHGGLRIRRLMNRAENIC
jgi:hypothetical protein